MAKLSFIIWFYCYFCPHEGVRCENTLLCETTNIKYVNNKHEYVIQQTLLRKHENTTVITKLIDYENIA